MAEWAEKILGFGKYNKQQKQITGDYSLDRFRGSLIELSRQMRFI
jgi:hypothetical protein